MDMDKKSDVSRDGRKIIICPVCHNRLFPYADLDWVKDHYCVYRGRCWCPFCGWELTVYTDGARLPEYSELYEGISSLIPNYRWMDNFQDWEEYAAKHMARDKIEPDFIVNQFASLMRGEIGLIASKHNNGEVQFISELMDRLGEDLELIDLYSCEREMAALCSAMGAKYKTWMEIEKESKDSQGPTFEQLVSAIQDMDCTHHLVLYGIDAVRERILDKKEMKYDLGVLKALAIKKDIAIVAYCCFPDELAIVNFSRSAEPVEFLLGVDIQDKGVSDLIVVLRNSRVVYYQ